MSRKQPRHIRRLGQRRYRRRFILSVEGTVTEHEYFGFLKQRLRSQEISVVCLKNTKSQAPNAVLKRLQDELKHGDFGRRDEAWLVVDRDHWSPTDLDGLSHWAAQSHRYGLAVSNPDFEYWLLLHFESGRGIRTVADVRRRLERHIPNYNKRVPHGLLTIEMIQQACEKARSRDNFPHEGWPTRLGVTTVYRLVEQLLDETQQN